MDFIFIENPRSQFMLVQITGVNPAHRGNPLSYWRLEFIRPRNARERAQREQQREDDWARLEAEERFLTAELERREALHLERAMREDIHDNRQPNANNNIAAPHQPQPRRLVDIDRLDRLDRLDGIGRPVGTTLERQQEADLQQETDRLDRRACEMFRQRREAAEADQAEDETIVGRDFRRARRDSSVSPPPRRRQPFAEQSLEPWDSHLPNAGSDFWEEF